MKKVACIILSLMLVMAVISACAPKTELQVEEGSDVQVAGGWTLSSTEAKIPDDVAALLEKAEEGYSGMGLEPVAVIGTQVVAGVNYMILCKGTIVAQQPITKYVLVKLYAGLDGNAEILDVVDFDLGALEEKVQDGAVETDLAGGWNVPEEMGGAKLSDEAQKALDGALKGYAGAGFTPVAELGTKVVAGIEYALLSVETMVTAKPIKLISVVYVYAMADGSYDLKAVNVNPADFFE